MAEEKGILRILLIWMIVICIQNFFGEMMMGSILDRGFGYVIMYMFIMDTEKLVLTIFAGLALLVSGFFFSRNFMLTANVYFNEIRDLVKPKFVLYQYIFPFLLGIIIIQILDIPHFNILSACTRFSALLVLIPVFTRSFTMQDLFFDEEPREVKISLRYALTALVFLLIYRVLFGIGLKIAL